MESAMRICQRSLSETILEPDHPFLNLITHSGFGVLLITLNQNH